MVWTSILLSLLSLPLVWLIVPALIFTPIAFVLGLAAFIRAARRRPKPGALRLSAYALPMLLAIAVFWMQLWLVNTGYRA